MYRENACRIAPYQAIRSSLPEVFYKTAAIKNFAKFTEKCPSLFLNKVAGLQTCLQPNPKRDSDTGVFLLILKKYLGTPFL